VISHESALELLGLSDVVPGVIHITVPPLQALPVVPARRSDRIHTTTREIASEDTTVRDGVRVTSPLRSILDSAEAGLSPKLVIAATREARDRGLIAETLASSAR
jgi:predicted transcriptional regulator of viral defense system